MIGGVSQRALAQEMGKSAPYVSQVVNGEKNFIPEDWVKAAIYFDVTVDWLLCRPGAPMYWPSDAPDRVPDWSTWADEAARLIDALPPRRRDEALQLLRVISFHTSATEQEIEESVKKLRSTLAGANLLLSQRAIDAIKASMLAFAFGSGGSGPSGS